MSSERVRTRRRAAPRRADVVVIGGGIMGCASAWELAKVGASVIVLERSVVGAEASSAAAGILGAHVESERPGPMSDLCRLSLGRYPAWARDLERSTGLDVEFRSCGTLEVERSAKVLRRQLAARRWQGARALRTMNPKKLGELEPALARGLAGGLWFPKDARVDPKRLLEALRIAAAAAGVRFESETPVKRIEFSAGRARGVEIEHGTPIRADHVVVAAGSWTNQVAGVELEASAVEPARGQIVLLKAQMPVLRRVVFGPDCYLVPRDDGRILIGSTLEFAGYEKRVTAKAVRDLLVAAIRLVPALETAELAGTWSNFRPYTRDRLPIVGLGKPGLVYATGHFRNGILLAPITAEIVAALIRGKRPPIALDAFSPRRFSA